MEKYLAILGCPVRECVTKTEGIVTSVSFDLYGCVQAYVQAPLADDGDISKKSSWFDHKRLKVIDDVPVMTQPDFQTEIGPEKLPSPKSGPTR